MKITRFLAISVLCGAGLCIAATEFAAAQPFRPPLPGSGRVRVVPRSPAAVRRAPVVIHPGSPIRRPPRPVIVRPPRVVVRPRVDPRVFLPPVVFSGVVVVERYGRGYYQERGYSYDNLVWQETETLYGEEEWVEFTLDCDTHGSRLWFEVLKGRVQVDWAEVVFKNGEVQAVEFPERSLRTGLYELLDFGGGRRVDYVRMVAKTTSREAQLTLWLER